MKEISFHKCTKKIGPGGERENIKYARMLFLKSVPCVNIQANRGHFYGWLVKQMSLEINL